MWYEIWSPEGIRYGSVPWRKTAVISYEKGEVLVFYKFESGELVDDAEGYGYFAWLDTPVKGAYLYLARVMDRWNRRDADGNPVEALKWYQKELELFPDNMEAFVEYWVLKKEQEENIEEIRAVIQPKWDKLRYLVPEELFARIVLLDQIYEKPDEAKILAQRFFSQFPEHPLICELYLRYLNEPPVTLPVQCRNDWEYAWIFEPWVEQKLQEKKYNSVLKRVEEYFREFSIPRTPQLTQLCLYAAQAGADSGNLEAMEHWLNFCQKLLDSSAFTYHYLWRHPFSRKAKYRELKGAVYRRGAELYAQMGKNSEALNFWQASLPYTSETIEKFEVFVRVGELFAQEGNKAKALESYIQALVLEPENEDVKKKVRLFWSQVHPKAPASGWEKEVQQRLNPLEIVPTGFQFRDLSGKVWKWKNLPERPIVLNFWATWCPPCRREIPQLNEVAKKFPDVVFLALTKEKPVTITRFLKKTPFSYLIVPESASLFGIFNISSIPVHLILDENRVVRFRLVGGREDLEQVLTDRIQYLLKENEDSSSRR